MQHIHVNIERLALPVYKLIFQLPDTTTWVAFHVIELMVISRKPLPTLWTHSMQTGEAVGYNVIIKQQKFAMCHLLLNIKMTNLSDTSVASIQYRLLHSQQLLKQVAISDSVHGWHNHLKEWSLFTVLEAWNHLLPQVHTSQLKVHVVTPQIASIWKLNNTSETTALMTIISLLLILQGRHR